MRAGAFSLALAVALAAGEARAQAPQASDPLAAGLAADLAAPLRDSVPDAFGDRAAVALRVLGDAPAEAIERVAAGLSQLQGASRVVRLAEGDDLATLAPAALRAGAPRVLVVRVTAAAQGAQSATASLYVVDPGPWFTFLAAAPPAPERVAEVTRASEAAAQRPAVGPRWPGVAAGRPRVVPTPFRATVALALADLDADRRDELVIVTAERVRVARFAGASLAFVADAPGNAAMARALAPLRQPLGSATGAAGAVRYRTSTLATMGEVRLEGGAVRVRSLAVDLYPAQGFGCVALAPGGDAVTGVVGACDGAAPSPESTAAVPVAWVEALPDGTRRRWEARTHGDGQCIVRRDGVVVGTLSDVASPLVLDDLDGDGRLDLFAASASAPGAPDRVRVFALGDRAEERPSVSVPGAIEAMAAGDVDGDGRRELVVSVLDPARRTSTLWIIP